MDYLIKNHKFSKELSHGEKTPKVQWLKLFLYRIEVFNKKKKRRRRNFFLEQTTKVQARPYGEKTKITIVQTRRGHKNIDPKLL